MLNKKVTLRSLPRDLFKAISYLSFPFVVYFLIATFRQSFLNIGSPNCLTNSESTSFNCFNGQALFFFVSVISFALMALLIKTLLSSKDQ